MEGTVNESNRAVRYHDFEIVCETTKLRWRDRYRDMCGVRIVRRRYVENQAYETWSFVYDVPCELIPACQWP